MAAVQSNMQTHDELAALFSRNLTFNSELQAPQPQETPRTDPASTQTPSQPIVYSISQHYHHSTHNLKPQPQTEPVAWGESQRRSSAPVHNDTVSSENILRIHGINPSNLTPSQLQLFRIADTQQQMRLLELWSICPPNTGGDIPALAWSSTTMEQEEQLARLRLERSHDAQIMSSEGGHMQSQNGSWAQQPESEPYMASGYEELMRRERETQGAAAAAADEENFNSYGNHYTHATDPVYGGPDWVRQQQQQLNMATQYGAFQQFGATAKTDAMDVM